MLGNYPDKCGSLFRILMEVSSARSNRGFSSQRHCNKADFYMCDHKSSFTHNARTLELVFIVITNHPSGLPVGMETSATHVMLDWTEHVWYDLHYLSWPLVSRHRGDLSNEFGQLCGQLHHQYKRVTSISYTEALPSNSHLTFLVTCGAVSVLLTNKLPNEDSRAC